MLRHDALCGMDLAVSTMSTWPALASATNNSNKPIFANLVAVSLLVLTYCQFCVGTLGVFLYNGLCLRMFICLSRFVVEIADEPWWRLK